MSILNPKLRSGHRDGVIFQPLPNGRQVVRSMPSHYRTSYHPRLVESREKFRNLTLLYHALKPCIGSCFTLGTTTQSLYNRFLARNLALCTRRLTAEEYAAGKPRLECVLVSDGDLPSLEQKIIEENGNRYLIFKLDASQWKTGDVVRFIRLEPSGCTSSDFSVPCVLKAGFMDTVITSPKACEWRSDALGNGAYAFVHMRPSIAKDKDVNDPKSEYRVSSQRLIA